MISGTVKTNVLERRTEDLRLIFENQIEDLLSDIRDDYRKEIKAQFDSEGSPRWEKLNVAYLNKKRKIVGDKPILQFKEVMKKGYIEGGRIEGDKLIFDFPTIYARRHQFGDPSAKLPQRAINLDFVEKVGMKRIQAFTVTKVKQVGFMVKA